MPSVPDRYDCIILGGGPAGLAAGVYLGRYRRPTLVLNHKKPMSLWHRPTAHNVLGFPAGIHRNQLLEWGAAHIAKYECVRLHNATITAIAQNNHGFMLTDSENAAYHSTGLILAMGFEHILPDIPNIMPYAGRSIWHCPECDGYKCEAREIVILGTGRGSAEMALETLIWSSKVTLCTHGRPPDLDQECIAKLHAANIPVVQQKIRRIIGNPEDGTLEAFELSDATRLPAQGAFSNSPDGAPDPLLSQLPLKLHKNRWIKVNGRMRTNINCCYAAGDIVAHAQTQLSVAMGTAATAAIGLHKELLPAHLRLSGHQW